MSASRSGGSRGTVLEPRAKSAGNPSVDDQATAASTSWTARLLVWMVLVAVLSHTAVIALWVGPSNPIREEVGPANLRSYVSPVFHQNWQIFAPTPRRIAVTFEFRAKVRDPESNEIRTTEWIDAVEGEDALIRGNPFPPRMALAARRVTNNLNSAMREMNAEQRRQIAANYRTTPVEELRPRLLLNEGDSPAVASVVDSYMLYDSIAVEFATYYANHVWGGDVTEVQYRTARRAVPAFSERATRSIVDAEPTVYEYGWRAAPELPEHTVALFAAYVDAARDE